MEAWNASNPDRYFGSTRRWCVTRLASCGALGILSQRWAWFDSSDCTHPGADGATWMKGRAR